MKPSNQALRIAVARRLPALATALLLALSGRLGAQTSPAPAIASPGAEFDFGDADQHDRVTHTFVLTNAGNAVLTLSQLRAPCGCLLVEPGAFSIPPGSNTALRVELNLKGRQGAQVLALYVHSNDPARPIFQFKLTGRVHSDVVLQPPTLTFARVTRGEKIQARVDIAATNRPVHILGLETNAPFAAFSLSTNAAPGHSELAMTAGPFTNAESFRGKLVLLTDHPNYSRIEIPVALFVQGDLILAPSELAVSGRVWWAAQTAWRFAVRSRDQKPVHIDRLETPGKTIRAEILQNDQPECRLRVSGLPGRDSIAEEKILIHARYDDGRRETLCLPIRVNP